MEKLTKSNHHIFYGIGGCMRGRQTERLVAGHRWLWVAVEIGGVMDLGLGVPWPKGREG